MLPGFRFLFAATLLTVSLVVFGLGAAALLRASHERFVSLPAHPAPAPVFTQTADAAPPTLSMLRVETAPVETRPESRPAPSGDTLMATDKIATLSAAPRIEDSIQPLPAVAEPAPETTAEIKPETPKVEASPEPKFDVQESPTTSAPELPVQAVAPAASPAETVVAAPTPAPVEPSVVGQLSAPAKIETPAAEPAQQNAAAIPEFETTGSTTTPQIMIEPPLINAKPIRRPPVPADRPAAADIVAALPDPAVTAPALEKPKPVARKPRPVVKRAVTPKRRVVARPAPQRPAALAPTPASPFGAPAFRASPFGT